MAAISTGSAADRLEADQSARQRASWPVGRILCWHVPDQGKRTNSRSEVLVEVSSVLNDSEHISYGNDYRGCGVPYHVLARDRHQALVVDFDTIITTHVPDREAHEYLTCLDDSCCCQGLMSEGRAAREASTARRSRPSPAALRISGPGSGISRQTTRRRTFTRLFAEQLVQEAAMDSVPEPGA